MIMIRLSSILAGMALGLCATASIAAPLLRAEARVAAEIVTLGDLVDGVTEQQARTPLFAAPQLGATGTIQASRVIDAARAVGISRVDASGITQVVVTRPGRRIGTAEIEGAVRLAIGTRHTSDPASLTLVFDGAPPSFVLPVQVDGDVVAEDVVYDPRARRVGANVSVAALDGSRRRVFRIEASVVETAAVAVLTRGINRGDTIEPGDVAIERRPREQVTGDVVSAAELSVGRIARRAMAPGTPLRTTDLQKPEIVARNEIVTLVYEKPGMMLTSRGKALEAGGLGDSITLQNPTSKRTLQGIVSGPGRVSVMSATPGPVAAISQ